jgi:aminoglycoside/choline kinase family phosphotransferase
MQSYDLPQFPVVHADFYRLSDASELAELGFDDLPDNALVLIEWPERAGSHLPPDRLDIALSLAPKLKLEFRHARVTGYGAFAPRVNRIARVRQFISESGYGEAMRTRIQGDASTRSYERFALGDKHVILMNSPARPDGPPVRDGKPYSAIAHLAETVSPFVAIANGLRERGFSAPAILHADLAQGLLFIEDFGDERVCAGDPPSPIQDRYEVAVDALVALHRMELPATLPVAPQVEYRVPPYDLEAYLIEAELLLDWYLPRFGVQIAADDRERFRELWRQHLQPALAAPPTWVLRDFHSPNLLWLPQREGIARLGILDFQDALMGPAAYDLASLLQDARIDVPEQIEVALLGRYVLASRNLVPQFNHTEFIRIYVTLAAQRASKILGIFSRLDMRDGKPQYLRHLPRIWGYLQRSLGHPGLKPLRAWYDTNVPSLKTI